MTQDTSTRYSHTVKFAVEGMNCGSCVRHIGEALDDNFGHLLHEINLVAKTLTVSFEPGAVTEGAIAQVMNDAGYSLTKL